MESEETLRKQAFIALSEFMRDRMCMLGGGTGNLLTVDRKLYVSTCYHVAQGFFTSNEYRYVTLRKNDRIIKSHLRLVDYKMVISMLL